jgi:hypothetical protein
VLLLTIAAAELFLVQVICSRLSSSHLALLGVRKPHATGNWTNNAFRCTCRL